MYKFAHIADCHLGAHRDPILRKLELSAFEKVMRKCIEEEVDFIIISGDLFHSNLPDMRVVNQAVRRMKEVRDHGIPIYLIYGSHDYSPNETSIVDILDSAGLFTKVVKGKTENGKLKLEFTIDPKTKAKIVGISARKIGMEEKFFEMLDRESLEKEEGFKIFMFHCAISEFKPGFLSQMESVPISYFPKGFNYYAGGHIHKRIEQTLPDYRNVVYPGPIFAGYPRDFEQSAKGEKRGFYIVSFDDDVKSMNFVEIPICEYYYHEYDASNKNSTQVEEELIQEAQRMPVKDKIVLLKVKGELSGGKTADINFGMIRKILMDNGALHVSINRFALTSKEYTSLKVMGQDSHEIEAKLLRESIGTIKVLTESLKGENGANLALKLLHTLRQTQKPNENKKDYESRILESALKVLRLSEVLK